MSSVASMHFRGSGMETFNFDFDITISGDTPSDEWLADLYDAVAVLVPSMPNYHGPLIRDGMTISYTAGHNVEVS